MPKRKRESHYEQSKVDEYLKVYHEINAIFQAFPQHKTDLEDILSFLMKYINHEDTNQIVKTIVAFKTNDNTIPDLENIYLLLDKLSKTGDGSRVVDYMGTYYYPLSTPQNIQTILKDHRRDIPRILNELNQLKDPLIDGSTAMLSKILSKNSRKQSIHFLGFLHQKIGARSPLNRLAATNSMFDYRVTRLVLDLADAQTTSKRLKS